MKWIPTILTVIFIAIPVFCAWRGYKNGIIRGACGILAVILALFCGNIIANMYSSDFDGMLSPFVNGMVDGAENTVLTNDDKAVIQLDDSEKDDVYSVSYAIFRQLGVVENAAQKMAEEVAAEHANVDQSMCDTVGANLSARFSYILVFCIAFALVAILFAVIGNVINISLQIPILGVAEPILGIALGVIKGLIIMYAVAMFLRYFGIIIPDEALEGNEFIFKLVNENPVADKFGI
ncbi:MAG: CvpA family protein [Oscillospiraceae bacterium]|nr:CvpA family protein [Oscillospiraceae bacterium]